MKRALLKLGVIVSLLYCNIATGRPIKVLHDLPAKSKMYLSQEPEINDIVNVVYEITPQSNVDTLFARIFAIDGAQIIGKQHLSKNGKVCSEKYFVKTKKGKIYKYIVKIKVVSSPFRIVAEAWGKGYTDENGKIEKLGRYSGPAIYYYLDENTGRMRTIEQAKTDITYRYDPTAGEFLKEPDASCVEINRGIIKRMKTFEPALSDSEALALHGDMVQGIMFGIGHSKNDASKPPKETEDKIIKYLLKEGWFEKLKNGIKDKWFERLKKDSKAKYDKGE